MQTTPISREAESDLVRALKDKGMIAVRALSKFNLNLELAMLAVSSAEERYRDLKIIPVECVLREGYSFDTDVSHVAYASFYGESQRERVGKIGVAVNDPSGHQQIVTL